MIQPLAPTKVRDKRRMDDRRVSKGIFWRLRKGAPCADIPARYGPHMIYVNRFDRWRMAGHWARILQAVSEAHDGNIQMINSSSIPVHQHGAHGSKKRGRSDCMGRSRGGLTTKIRALVRDRALDPVQTHRRSGP